MDQMAGAPLMGTARGTVRGLEVGDEIAALARAVDPGVSHVGTGHNPGGRSEKTVESLLLLHDPGGTHRRRVLELVQTSRPSAEQLAALATGAVAVERMAGGERS